jgi:hypothetical protein
MCLQHHYFSRFTTHVGRCRLLLSNHAIQQISRSSEKTLANRKPSLPHPHLPKLFVTVKKCAKTGKEMQLGSTKNHISRIFFMLSAPIYWWEMVSSTNVLVRYKGNFNVSSTLPIQQAIAYSISCSKWKRK